MNNKIQNDPYLGTVLDDKYELVEMLGGGGTGVVYRAKVRGNADGNLVAIKMLSPNLISRQYAVRRFEQEAKATASLSHPNILKVIDFGGQGDGPPYLVMEILEGASLADFMKDNGFLSAFLAAEIITQAAQGMLHAHGKGVIHRDLKPSNLMIVGNVGETFTVKIVDFGLAKPNRSDERMAKITVTGEVFGSPAYMSPEQCKGEEVDHRADIYALGCVLFEALTGRPPYVGKDPIDTIFKHVAPEMVQFEITGSNQKLIEQMKNILHSSMAKSKEERYQSMSDMLQHLNQFQHTLKSEGGDIKFSP